MTTKIEYKIEDLKFLNMKKIAVYKSSPRYTNGMSIFEIENELTREEKIELMDEMRDDIASYMLNIIKKWEDEKEELPKDNYGYVKTVSKKAWIKRNDPLNIVNIKYIESLGSYYMFKNEFKGLSLECPSTEYGYSMEHTGGDIVDQWFHDFCSALYLEEKKYFEKTDTKEIKLAEVKEKFLKYHIYFDEIEINDIGYNGKKDVSEERLDEYIKAFDKLEEKIKEISIELNS